MITYISLFHEYLYIFFYMNLIQNLCELKKIQYILFY